MKTEKQKMIAGELYKASDKQLVDERLIAKEQVYIFNSLSPSFVNERASVVKKMFGSTLSNFYIEPPFRCDYGYNIHIGDNFYANYNLVILDCARVTIGNHVLVGPNVSIYTATHPLQVKLRLQEYEFALPISIGNNVWIGGSVVINPGVTIGDNSIIGSGSVVTKNIPANVVAVGNPCKVIRKLTDLELNS